MAGTFTTIVSPMTDDASNITRRTKRTWNKFTGQEDEQPTMTFGGDKVSLQGDMAVNLAARFIADSMHGIEDPGFDMVLFQPDLRATSGLLANPDNCTDAAYVNSAAAYLNRIGDTYRLNLLRTVWSTLNEMFGVSDDSQRRGYVLKAVSGFNGLQENHHKQMSTADITLDLYDTVKWEIRTLNAMLEQILWDDVRQVEVLPLNLRQFNCNFLIKDVRDLSKVTNQPPADANTVSTGTKPTEAELEQNRGQLVFVDVEHSIYQSMLIECRLCEFKPNYLPDSVSNIESAELQGNLVIAVPKFKQTLFAPALNAVISNPGYVAKQQTKRDKYAFIKAATIGLLASSVNALYSSAKGRLMNGAYQFLEQNDVLRYTNAALALTNGNFIGQELDRALTNAMAKQIAQDMYFSDTKYADFKTNANTSYFGNSNE